MIWKNGEIDALNLPNGMFLSKDLTFRRVEMLQNNTGYREAIEKAMRMTGNVDKALVMSRAKPADAPAIAALIKQNDRAEQLIKGKRNDETPALDNASVLGG